MGTEEGSEEGDAAASSSRKESKLGKVDTNIENSF